MIELHTFDDQRTQSDALAQAVEDALTASLAAKSSNSGQDANTMLAVSGGSSPKPFLQTLSTRPFDWSRIVVTLVDDRWVPADDKDSNTRFAHEFLLQHEAKHATFWPLVDTSTTLEAHVAALNADARFNAVPDVAVLGMGEDGHTASIFADAPEWDHALIATEPFVAVHPGAAPHARVSWSMPAIKRVNRLFLLIAGQRKLDVLNAAAASLQKNAISQLANDKGVRLDVYWSAN